MPSQIDPQYPVQGEPQTQNVRDNFQHAKDELDPLVDFGALIDKGAGAGQSFVAGTGLGSTIEAVTGSTFTPDPRGGNFKRYTDPGPLTVNAMTVQGWVALVVPTGVSVTLAAGYTGQIYGAQDGSSEHTLVTRWDGTALAAYWHKATA